MRIDHEIRKQLANSLEKAKGTCRFGCILKTSDLQRADRERLVGAGFLIEIIRGWYLLATSYNDAGSTAWYGGYWPFLKVYLEDRFGAGGYCLSAESSINVYSGDTRIQKQLLVITTKATNSLTELPHKTSIFFRTTKDDLSKYIKKINGVNVMSLEYALSTLTAQYFVSYPENVEIALNLKGISPATITRALMDLNSVTSAERTVGAFKYLGKIKESQEIADNLKVVGFNLKDESPFESYNAQLKSNKPVSPYVSRIRIMWNKMKQDILKIAPKEPGLLHNQKEEKIKVIKEAYNADAYHSLSIEGYQVTPELIEKIKIGNWNPDVEQSDKGHINALAARGYHDAFHKVVESVFRVLNGDSPAQVLDEDIQKWYRDLFSTFVKSGLFQPMDIAGYRNQQVYIKKSRHIPPRHEAVADCIQELIKLISNESNAFVRSVLGHFIFVYIHPYGDGNGRIGRFILNLMLVSGGYNWTIVRNENRSEYMESLEEASVRGNIVPFTEFIIKELNFSKEKFK